jgi:hypothetical protein
MAQRPVVDLVAVLAGHFLQRGLQLPVFGGGDFADQHGLVFKFGVPGFQQRAQPRPHGIAVPQAFLGQHGIGLAQMHQHATHQPGPVVKAHEGGQLGVGKIHYDIMA